MRILRTSANTPVTFTEILYDKNGLNHGILFAKIFLRSGFKILTTALVNACLAPFLGSPSVNGNETC
jgi:hypothetical protein